MEKHFKNDAKQIVDLLFDAKIFKDSITRDDMNTTEEFVEYLLSSRFDSYLKLKSITDKMDKKDLNK